MTVKTKFSESDIEDLKPNEKLGIIGTVNDEGLPHISLITTIFAKSPDQIIMGEFSVGESKKNMRKTKKTGFLIMTMDRSLWRGKAVWTHAEKSGADYEKLNDIPMYRYNTYFGINTVHYLNLVETSEKQKLPMGKIILSAVKTKITKGGLKSSSIRDALPAFGVNLFNDIGALKFVSYINDDGFPEVIPVVQCQASSTAKLAFHTGAFGEDISAIKENSIVAVFALNLKMESVLTRGIYRGVERKKGVSIGTVDIDWVYNSMPPAHGQIYPQAELKPVVDF